MDQTGPEFFMKSYCGSGNGRSQDRIIFPCQTGLGRRGRTAGTAPQGTRRRVRAARQQQGSRSRRFVGQGRFVRKNCAKFYFQGWIVRP
jgi:hypothetical protein